MQDSPFSKSWHHAAAAPLPASGQNGIYRKNDTQLDFAENRTSVPMPTAAAGDNESKLRGQILFALKRTNGNKAAAAKLLGIDRTTLWRRMRRLGIE